MSTHSLLTDNIVYLRKQRTRLSQEKIAEILGITRDRYAKYEMEKSAPPLDVVVAISRFYHISTDLLLTVDLRKYNLEEIRNLHDNRILFPIKTDEKGENKIEIVPFKASMGYLRGFSDPEFIEGLQTISLPFLRNGKYRGFQTEGDSMPPHKNGSYVVGSYVEAINDLKVGKTYIFITNEGITYKRLSDQDAKELEVSADNHFYKPYKIPKQNLIEMWEYKCSIATEEFDKHDLELDNATIIKMFYELKQDLKELKG